MKKIRISIALALALLMCAVGIVMITAAPQTVYVSSAGNDSNSGESETKPLKTLEAAIERMPKGGKIVMCGTDYTVAKDYVLPASEGKYTLTSKMTGAFKYSGTFELNSDFVIENITFQGSSTPIIVCNGHNVTFGKGIKNNTNSYIVGGANLTADTPAERGNLTKDYKIEVNSGTWVNFFGGNRRATGSSPTCTINADITIVIDGATFKITGAAVDKNNNNLSGMNGIKGDLNFEMKSGEIWGSLFAIGRIGSNGKKCDFKGDVNIKISGGTFRNLATDSNASKGNGVLNIVQDSTTVIDGNYHLEISDKADVGCTEINSKGIKGRATLDVPSYVVSRCYGFVRDVYVGATGSDSNGGTSKTDAYKTLEKAVSAVAESGGTVVLCSDAEISSDTVLKASKESITITSKYKSENYKSSAKLTVNAGLALGCSVTFDDITLAGTGTIYANGYTLIAEDGVACDGKLNISASSMTGDSSSGGQAVLLSGSYNTVSAGSVGGKGAKSVTNTLVSVEGATVKVLAVSGGNDISGSAVASILSGKVTDGIFGIYGTDSAKVSGKAIVEIAGGTVSGKICAAADGVSGEASGTFELSLLGGEIGAVSTISGKGFANTTAKVPDEHLSKLSDFDSVAKELVLFVCDGGKGKRDGSSPENAIATVKEAIEALGADTDGTIVVCAKTTVSGVFKEPARNNKIKFTSRYAGVDYRRLADAKFVLSDRYVASGDVSFDDIVISTDGKTRIFFGNGNPLSFGEGVECVIDGSGTTYPYIFGGFDDSAGSLKGTSLTVSGGTWHRIEGGNRYSGTYVLGDISVKINGGNVVTFVSGTGKSNVKGNITIEINGGTIRYGVFAIYASSSEKVTAEGNIEVYLNGGTVKGKVCASKYDNNSTFNGEYTCYINRADLDSVTDIRGSANVGGTSISKRVFGAGVSAAEPQGTVEINNPICSGADPWVIYHDGFYYMAITRGASVTVAKAANVSELGEAEQVAVWSPTEVTGLSTSIWSPELHYFSAEEFGEEHAGWYLYVACTPYNDKENNALRRCYVLKARSDDPQGSYGSPTNNRLDMALQIKMDSDNTNWNIGPSIIRIEGKTYMTWTGRVYQEGVLHKQNIQIAEMVNPYTLNLDRHGIICTPTESWEKHGATYSGNPIYPEVVEGATAVYGDNGEIYIIYSASGYWTSNYALAQLKFKGGDPTDINNWQKSPQPIFTQNSYVFGPGHASYVKSPDGKTNFFIYHGYPTSAKEARYVYIEEFTVDANGVHLGSGNPANPSEPIVINKNPRPLSMKISGFGDSTEDPITKDPAQDPADTTTQAPEPQPEPKPVNVGLIVAIAVAVVVVAGVVVFIVIKNKATK